MRLLAPAKINLHLRVGPPQVDGFHSLLSWFCTVGLFDTLTFTLDPSEAGRGDLVVRSDRSDLPTDARNLVYRVGKALADTPDGDEHPAGQREGVSVFIEKRIPIGAGLGGGSSDAARTLLGLNNLWGIGWSAQQLSEFGARFGSDVPFFFHGPSSVCTGRGEIVRPIAPPSAHHAVLVTPAIHMPTPNVYRRFDEMKLGDEETINRQPDWNAWARLPSVRLLAELVNDLEAPAFSLMPVLDEMRRSIERLLSRVVRMSGSGSSLFTLYDDAPAAIEAAEQISVDLKIPAQHVELAPKLLDDLSV
jgi:4-diphosphocytidyl-2-C-methyl-D-erythritol kinase